VTVCAELVNLIHDFRLRDVARHARAAAIRLFASQRRLTFDAGDFDFGLKILKTNRKMNKTYNKNERTRH
jgi:hypothetical protein